MHLLPSLIRLLRPQRRRVAVLVAVILATALVELALLPGLSAGLFTVLMGAPPDLGGRYTDVPVVAETVSWLNRILTPPPEAPLRPLFFIAFALLVTAFLRSALAFAREYLGQYVGGRALIDLRMQLFSRLQRLSLSFYEGQRVGDLMSRLTTDVALVQQLITTDMADYLLAPAIVLGGLAAMFWLNWKLTLFVFVFAPLASLLIARAGRRMTRLAREQQERIADLTARLHERLASIRIIQSFAREDYEVGQFRDLNERSFDAVMRVARVRAIAPPAIQFLSAASFAAVGTYAGMLVIEQHMNIPGLMGFFVLTQRVGFFFLRFGTLHLRVSQSLAALNRVMEVAEREPDLQERPDAAPLPRVDGRVSLHDVSLQYPNGEVVLQGINLGISAGEVLALVGPSGAGKTSLANLVMRFYDPAQGRVEVDGRDVRDVTLHSLRSQIGLVPQETVLFGGTIGENIRYGRVDATDEEVVEAAKAANAHDFITALPAGYRTEVGERGVRLSGGQRQRIAIARAVLKDPRILILDEATSSLDAESENLVQEALERLLRGRTTIVIAHRLSTIQRADRIIVLSDGKIVEEGRHEQLLNRGGVYSRLYRIQESRSILREASQERLLE